MKWFKENKIITISCFILICSCNNKEVIFLEEESIMYPEDMFLSMEYNMNSTGHELCENIPELSTPCNTGDHLRFRSYYSSNINQYTFFVFFGAEQSSNSPPSMKIGINKTDSIVGSHLIDNSGDHGHLSVNYRILNNGNVLGAYALDGSVNIDRISDHTFMRDGVKYKIVYGSLIAEMRREGLNTPLNANFQLPFIID